MTREHIKAALYVLAVLLLWEAGGRSLHAVRDVIASPTLILAQYRSDADLYVPHVLATLGSASLGFVFGNAVAVIAAILFCRFPAVENVFSGVNIALFAMPPIVVGPVLAIVFRDNLPQVILAALVVYFPTMAATLVGLRDVDSRLLDVISAYGGGPNTVMRFVRLRSALPAVLSGLRTAATLAVLGAILGEFGSGARWGLGSFLLGSLGSGNPARLLGIGFAATVIAMAGYAVFAWIGRRVLGATVDVTIAANRLPDRIAVASKYSWPKRAAYFVAAVVTPFLLWWLILKISHLSPIIAPGPMQTLRYLISGPDAADARGALFTALGQTLPLAALGMIGGIAAAFVVASLSVVRPAIAKAVLPGAILLQSTPLVALVPIVLLLFGRDTAATLAISMLIVFFPAYVMLAQGFALVPRAARELVQVYGGSRTKELTLISVPYAARYLYAAAKLVAPRALLGVMIAEWLLSGRGLGNLLNVSRGTLDYDMVWTGAVVSILISVVAYEGISAIERLDH